MNRMHHYILPLALLLSTAPSLVNAQAVSQPSFEACFYYDDFKSGDGTAQNVTFEADSNLTEPVQLYWIDYDGNIQFYNTIFPGFYVDLSTYVGHGWVGMVGDSCAYVSVGYGTNHVLFAFDQY